MTNSITFVSTIDPVVCSAASFRHSESLRTKLKTPVNWVDPFMPFEPSKLPPLPEIPCPRLRKRAVRHKTANPRGTKDCDKPLRYEFMLDSYEVLEGLGDAHLTASVGRILRRRYPDLTTGPLFDLRERLVRNDTISYISLAYGLPSRLEYDHQTSVNERQSVAADLFEAHIGALFEYEDVEGNESGVNDWLRAIFSPEVWPTMDITAEGLKARKLEQDETRNEQRRLKKTGPIARWHCAMCDVEMNSVVLAPKFTFDTFDPVKGWHAKMYLDGHFTSCGRSKVKKDAEFAAAINHVGGLRPPNFVTEAP